MSGDWDPFADPADTAQTHPCGDDVSKMLGSVNDQGFAQPDDREGVIDRPVCDFTGELPRMPRVTTNSGAAFSSQEFATELNNICQKWDLMVPSSFVSQSRYPDNEDGRRMMALRSKVEGADVEMKVRYMSILARKSVAQLDNFRMKRPSSSALFFSLMKFAGELGGSLSDECVAVEPKEPFSGRVVIILGYGGSTLADLSDCAPAYHEMDPGCLVVALVFRPLSLAGAGQLAFALERAVNAWAEATTEAPRLFIHMHSNLGLLSWKQLLQLWDCQVRSPDRNRLRGPVPMMSEVLAGIVLDSCPDGMIPRENSLNSIMQSYAAQLSSFNGTDENGNPMDPKQVAKEAFRAKMLVMERENLLQKHFAACSDKEIFDATGVNTNEIHEKEPPAPQLFIFSTADTVIAAAGVERYIGEIRSRADAPSLIQQLKLINTNHCQHRKSQSDREVYWDAVSKFWLVAMGLSTEQ